MTTPLILAYVGMAVMLTLSCTGSAIGVTMGGNTTIAALKKKPEIFGKSMLLCVLPSTQGLYGFAAFFLMLSSLGGMEDASQVLTMNQGLAMCAAGLALGFVGLWSAIKQASLVCNGINEMSNGNEPFRKRKDTARLYETASEIPVQSHCFIYLLKVEGEDVGTGKADELEVFGNRKADGLQRVIRSTVCQAGSVVVLAEMT